MHKHCDFLITIGWIAIGAALFAVFMYAIRPVNKPTPSEQLAAFLESADLSPDGCWKVVRINPETMDAYVNPSMVNKTGAIFCVKD